MSRQGTGLTRAQWLEAGQDILRDEGIDGVKLQALTTRLNISTGSFYHHFGNFDAYLEALATSYAAEQVEHYLVEARQRAGSDALARLVEVSRIVARERSRELSLAMRAWGRSDARAAQTVRQIDAVVLRFLEEIFLDLGFSAEQAAMRALLAFSVSAADIDPGILGRPLPAFAADIVRLLTSGAAAPERRRDEVS